MQYPELDIRQRLTVSRGYGAAEWIVGEESGIAGKSFKDSGLREHDIVVLSLTREGKVIANPRGARVIEVGDRLLCFGKIENMKNLLPPEVRKRRTRKIEQRSDGVAR
ncbi:MAG: TrkA C-terminal domain-containing protein [Leptospirales bacterium]